jgi:hypothetical protein
MSKYGCILGEGNLDFGPMYRPCRFECNCTLFLLILDLILVLPHGNFVRIEPLDITSFRESLFPDSHGCDYVFSDPRPVLRSNNCPAVRMRFLIVDRHLLSGCAI